MKNSLLLLFSVNSINGAQIPCSIKNYSNSYYSSSILILRENKISKSFDNPVIFLNSARYIEENQSINNPLYKNNNKKIDLIGDVPDKVFNKPGAYYQEKSKRKNSRKSTTSSELTFRQTVDTVDGKKKDFTGASDPQDPQNLEKFERAGIPIDRMKDPRKEPDDHNKWKWDKKEKQWLVVGEEKIKLPTGKIITASQWNDMIRNHSKKI